MANGDLVYDSGGATNHLVYNVASGHLVYKDSVPLACPYAGTGSPMRIAWTGSSAGYFTSSPQTLVLLAAPPSAECVWYVLISPIGPEYMFLSLTATPTWDVRFQTGISMGIVVHSRAQKTMGSTPAGNYTVYYSVGGSTIDNVVVTVL